MGKVNVLITGVGGGGVGGRILRALRSAETEYRITCTDNSPESWELYQGENSYLVPNARDETYIERIHEICKKEDIVAIFPGSEPELMRLSEERKVFSEEGIILMANNPDVIGICQDKWKTYQFFKQNGFHTPKSQIIKNDMALENLEVKFPLLLKPYVGGGGSRSIYIAQTPEELKFFSGYMQLQGIKPMAQEYIGSTEEEYTVGVLHSFDGDLLGSIAIKRRVVGTLHTLLRIKDYQNPNNILGVSTGVSQGIVDDFPEVQQNAEKIAEKLGSRGPLNVQCRVVDGKVYTFEINPRFSGTESIRAVVGYNAPDALIRKHILGKNIDKLSYKKGLILRGIEDYYIDMDKYNTIRNSGRISK